MIATPFHNQFGLQSIIGVAKPAYRAFQLLRDAGDRLATSQANTTVGMAMRGPPCVAASPGAPICARSLQRLMPFIIFLWIL